MSRAELKQIVTTGAATLGMTVDAAADEEIATLSQGLPHYTHLLGLHATREAIDAGSTVVEPSHVAAAIRKAIEGRSRRCIAPPTRRR